MSDNIDKILYEKYYDRFKRYYDNHKEEIYTRQKEYNIKNKLKRKLLLKNYYEKNKKAILMQQKEYRLAKKSLTNAVDNAIII